LDIYKQGIDQTTAETVYASPEDKLLFGLSSDGAWIFYSTQATPSARAKLMRAPISGGPAQLVSEASSGGVGLTCARLPSTFCVYATQEARQLILSSIDLGSGKKRELARVQALNFDVFPDGSGMAVIVFDPPTDRIRIIGSAGEIKTEFAVKGWSAISHIYCSADSKGLYLTSSSQPTGDTLLYVDLQGNASVLWQQKGSFDAWAVPSPDGRYLAIRGMTQTSDAWLLENF
jgi:hypothetical protein